MNSRKENSKVDYSEMSNKKCLDCNKPIKQNVVNRTEGVCYCYVCFKIRNGKTKVDQHKIVDGKKVFVKTVDFVELQKQNKRKYLNT